MDEITRAKKKNKSKWISGGYLEEMSVKFGYKASTGARELRAMSAKGYILKSETEKGYIQYMGV